MFVIHSPTIWFPFFLREADYLKAAHILQHCDEFDLSNYKP